MIKWLNKTTKTIKKNRINIMIKFFTNKKNILATMLLLIIFIAVPCVSYSTNGIKHVYISGQIINSNNGTPVVGHLVYVQSDSTIKDGGLIGYYKTIKTDSQGYYFDTIATNKYKGSLVIYTYDYYEKVADSNVHFRFLDRTSDVVMVDFSFYSPFQAKKLQAKFGYHKMQSAEGDKYSFIDETLSDSITSWHWGFGDGTTSTLQNPEHTYSTNGFFIVTLTVTETVNNIEKTSTATKRLYIYDRDYYHLGGHVFSDHFPIDKGYAYLFMVDSLNEHIVVDTITFDTLGYYFFYHIPKGNYIVKVEPMIESQYYGTLLPTYYGDKQFWEDAEIIKLNNTCWEYDINLKCSEGISLGEGSILGNVVFDDLLSSFIDFSLDGINIYLFDDDDNLLYCNYSDKLGSFAFSSIELSTYWLYPEVTGVQSERIKVELTTEIPIIDDIEIRVIDNGTSYVLPDEGKLESKVGLPFPNPTASEKINVPLNFTSGGSNEISYAVFNFYGQMVVSGKAQVNNNGYHISLADIKNGSYVIRTFVNDEIYDRAFIVAK